MKSEEGNASFAVLGAAVAAIFLATGLADLGIFFLARGKAQVAADAAALAAAAELIPGLGEDPEEQAADYALKNGAWLLECDCRVGAQAVEVKVATTAPFVLTSNYNSDRVTARARAEVDLSGSVP